MNGMNKSMKKLLILTLVGLSWLAQALPGETFALNYNAAKIAELQRLGLPLVPFPFLQVFIAGHVGTGIAAYRITAAGGTLSEMCVASLVPYDAQGSTLTVCVVRGEVVTGSMVQVQPLFSGPGTVAVPAL